MLEENEEIVVDFAEETEKVQLGIILQSQKEIAYIQTKLAKKGYLQCEECGDDIPVDRRVAYPSARTCITCQVWLEEHYARR